MAPTSAQKGTMMDAAVEIPPSVEVFEDSRDDPNCFPNVDEFMRALQDPGEMPRQKKHGAKSGTATSSNAVIVYRKLMKALTLQTFVQRTLQTKYSHFGIPKYPTDCKKQLALACIRIRKNRDKASVPDEFRKYAHEGSDTLFVINLDLGNDGFNIPLSACLDHWRSQKKKDLDSCNPNDACRVAAILRLPEFRESVSKIMSQRKDRVMLDQASCPAVSALFYEVAADKKFRDTSFIAQVPDKISLIDGHEAIDPNDEDRIMLAGRDGAWFKASWELYLRPKYRKTLAR